jgi:hypothetical protein
MAALDVPAGTMAVDTAVIMAADAADRILMLYVAS